MTSAPDPITATMEDVRQRLLENTDGDVATYIPELSRADPDLFGIALASLEGRVYSVGDADTPFTIQSVSKPFVYAMALADHGLETTLSRVGAEPTGMAFNAISLEPGTGRPANPMINAGAIVATSLVLAGSPDARFERIRETLSGFAGRDLEIDHAVYQSEMETGDRNRALGYLMRNAGSLTGSVDEALDVYFRQCSVLVTSRDLAVMAATLANGGVNPVSGQRVVAEQVASHVLTVMGTCGMYDFSGEWLLRVGLPAKSGVSGCVVAAKTAQFGLGVFSPRLDERGNSVRAIEVCRDLAGRFDLHLFNLTASPAATSYLEETGTRMHSPVKRSDRERAHLQEHGQAIAIRGLQGDIGFAAAESVMHSCDALTGGTAASPHWLILDMHRAGKLYQVARMMLDAMVTRLDATGVRVVVVDPDGRGFLPDIPAFGSLDDALQHCEDNLLARLS